MHVFLHLYDNQDSDPVNIDWDYPQIPQKGDFVQTNMDGPYFEVKLVLFDNFPESSYDAEIYAQEVDWINLVNKTFPLNRGMDELKGYLKGSNVSTDDV